jgi:signal transduction histidine kinase
MKESKVRATWVGGVFATVLVLVVAVLLYVLSQRASLGLLFAGGHLLVMLALSGGSRVLHRLSGGLLMVLLLLQLLVLLVLVQYICQPTMGWRAFLRLDDLAPPALLALAALWSPALGLWLWSLHTLEVLQERWSERSRRVLYLIVLAAGFGLVTFFDYFTIGYLPLTIGAVLWWLGQDFYLDSNRTSITWLLLWLLLLAMLLAAFAFRQSLEIDRATQAKLALMIEAQDSLDRSAGYHLRVGWDTLSYVTAAQRLPADLLGLEPGEGRQLLSSGRLDWIYHRTDGRGYIQLGHATGGYQPPLALASLLFMVGLFYVLCLRIVSWALAYPITQWRYPLFGPPSLRIRIQLSFFGIAFAAFFLVGWFTFRFFRNEPDFAYDLLEQLLSLYAFLLVAVGALGIILANSITEPIVRIGDKLGDTGLRDNQPLSWPRQDEIGRLVQSYNEMINALAERAEQLAATEREGAWREMARQVAHEIKNPLTPMKLQLQQLRRLEQTDPDGAREWSQRVSHRLIEQIDGLARIASEFSHFARLPDARPTNFDLRDLLQSAFDLHQENTQHASLQLELPEEPCPVYADRDQLLRLLNNLVRNGLQALTGERPGELQLALRVREAAYQMVVADNGSGIPLAIQPKLFQPNFTTKSSGTGLGLAMCKQIAEQAGGTISFTTVEGVGTEFVVELSK